MTHFYNKIYAEMYFCHTLIIKSPYQSDPDSSGLHRVPVGSKEIVPHKSYAVQQVAIGYEDPGP